MAENLLITGVSGCVGHYVFEALKSNPDYHFYLQIRDPKRLRFDLRSFSNVTILSGELSEMERYADVLQEMDYVVHLAVGWGVLETNYDETRRLFNLLSPQRLKKIIYFSTASILGPDNQPLGEVEKIGTGYIQGKYRMYKKIPELKVGDRVITLFPTWVVGGDKNHPYSHASLGILKAIKWLSLIRFFSIDASFHFIHARDIALIVDYLLKNETKERNFVLGNPAITADRFVEEVCRYFNRRIYFRIRISPVWVKRMAQLLGKKLSPWENYSIDHRHAEYKVVNADTFGIKSDYRTVADILREIVWNAGK